MNDREDRIRRLLQDALRQPREQRESWIRAQCGSDADLAQRTLDLLRAAGDWPLGASHARGNEQPTAATSASSAHAPLQRTPIFPIAMPASIGPYRIIRALGRGGMGEVFLGARQDEQSSKRVALKVIRSGISSGGDSDSVIRRFTLERRVLASLDHPNIARLIDAGQTSDGNPYFVMEFVEGEPITEYCDRHQLHTEERLRLFIKVCAAVQHAHQNLIVHRDIKPSNILVTPDGEPKLLDFGISKLVNPDVFGVTSDTVADVGPMTPEYASPEQVLGKPIGTASDIYSLGVLLYELLTGRPPYQLRSRAIAEMVRVIVEDDPERPSNVVTRDLITETAQGTTTIKADQLAKALGEGAATRLRRKLVGDIDNIVLHAMRKSPQRRYSSASAFAEDVERYLEGRPVSARADVWWYVTSKFVSRNRVAVIAATLGLVGVVAGGALAAVAWRGEQAARVAEAAQRQAADQRLAQVRALAERFLQDLRSRVEKRKGQTESLLLLAETSLSLLSELQAEFPQDKALKRELARGYINMANSLGGVRGARGGAVTEAGELLAKGTALRAELHQDDPSDLDLRREYVAALIDTVNLSLRLCNMTAASETADRAVQIAEQAGSGPEGARAIAAANQIRGDVYFQLEKLEDAERHYTRSMTIRRERYKNDVGDATAARDYTIGLDRLMQLAVKRADWPAAETMGREILAVRTGLWKRGAKEDDARMPADVARTSYKLVSVLLESPGTDFSELLALSERAVTTLRALGSADESDSRAAMELATAARLRARVLLRATPPDTNGAVEMARLAVDSAARTLSTDSIAQDNLHESALAKEVLGDAELAASRTPDAIDRARAAYRESESILRELAARQPCAAEITRALERVIQKRSR